MSRYTIEPEKFLQYDYERKEYLTSEDWMKEVTKIHNECFDDEAPIENPCDLFQLTEDDIFLLNEEENTAGYILGRDDKIKMQKYLLDMYRSKNIQCEYIFATGRYSGLRCMDRRAPGKTFCKCHAQQSKVKKQPEVRYSNARSALRVMFQEA